MITKEQLDQEDIVYMVCPSCGKEAIRFDKDTKQYYCIRCEWQEICRAEDYSECHILIPRREVELARLKN